jgi:hypothetical protein
MSQQRQALLKQALRWAIRAAVDDVEDQDGAPLDPVVLDMITDRVLTELDKAIPLRVAALTLDLDRPATVRIERPDGTPVVSGEVTTPFEIGYGIHQHLAMTAQQIAKERAKVIKTLQQALPDSTVVDGDFGSSVRTPRLDVTENGRIVEIGPRRGPLRPSLHAVRCTDCGGSHGTGSPLCPRPSVPEHEEPR